MSIQPPQGILNIPNATLRVGKLAVDSTAGFDTVFNNVERNTILLVDSTEYDDTKQWDLKMPNIFVATFEIKGAGSSFNFRNTSNGDATVGYTLTFSGTTLTLKYDDSVPILATATIPNLDATYGKVYLTYEKQYFTVTVDGTRVLSYKDTGTRTFPDGEYINFFAGTGTPRFQNLKVVAGHLISDGTSNVSLYGGLAVTSNLEVGQANLFVDTTTSRVGVGTTTPEATLHVSGNAYVSSNLEVGSSNLFVDTVNSRVGVGTDTPKESLDVVGNMHLTRVSNVSQIKVDSNVVTEYTGPHDRPLVKYPEVALTANSDKGYVASASSFTTREPWQAFDNNNTTSWTSGFDYSGTPLTGDQYLQLTLPFAIKVVKMYIKAYGSTNFQHAPQDTELLGSNDGETWNILNTSTDLPLEAYGASTFVFVNAVQYYKYLRLRITKIYTGSTSYARVAELAFYGYEEGSGSLDTTLKSVYNVPATTGTQLEVYYDAKDLTAIPSTVTDLSPNSNGGSVSGNPQVSNGAFVFDGSGDAIVSSGTSTSLDGNATFSISLWSKTNTVSSGSNALFMLGYFSNNKSTGLRIEPSTGNYRFFTTNSVSKTSPTTALLNEWTHITLIHEGTSGYKFYVNGVFIDEITVDNDLSLDSNPRVALGNYIDAAGVVTGTASYDGSIANFRLYSKALNAGQVQELYDYQKDYFLGSKSQVTLYKGHLGVGVTEPSGQLELAGDERIQEYPPRGMTGYETLVEGHGVFTASASSVFSSDEIRQAYQAFNGGTDVVNDDAWISKNNRYTSGLPNANAALINGVAGEWLGIQFPYPIKLKQIAIQNRSGAYNSRSPDSGILWGSNDGTKYEQVVSWSGLSFVANGSTPSYVTINATNTYRFFRLQGTKVVDTNTSDFLAIGELKFFGTPGPTTLDKGSLSLTRSLDVPRVSRYDVDTETPRPEKLVVDFDTTVNSSPTDISGKGNHGAFYGDAQYSPVDKAFKFDGTDDYTQTSITIAGGNMAWTQSMWFKVTTFPTDSNHYAVLSFFGNKSSLSGFITTYRAGKMWQDWYGNGVHFDYTFEVGQWYHAVSVYHGNTSTDPNVRSSMYINGVKQTLTFYSATSAPMTLPTSTSYELADYINASNIRHNGLISNVKLYSVALEPSEVQKLYRLGRTGRSMVISDTAVGIGKVPEAQLDVRGTARFADVHVGGDIYATGNITGYSDRRAKSDIEKIENALEKIEQLNGYTFTMKGKRYTGLIAQEILPVLPEAVTGSEETNYAVAYGNMMGLIVEAIKELKQKIG
jgi:hypothetical protein